MDQSAWPTMRAQGDETLPLLALLRPQGTEPVSLSRPETDLRAPRMPPVQVSTDDESNHLPLFQCLTEDPPGPRGLTL